MYINRCKYIALYIYLYIYLFFFCLSLHAGGANERRVVLRGDGRAASLSSKRVRDVCGGVRDVHRGRGGVTAVGQVSLVFLLRRSVRAGTTVRFRLLCLVVVCLP